MFKGFSKLFTFTAVLFCSITIFGADFQVNQINDAGDGVCDMTCTLRDAITAANNASTDDSISFSYGVFNPGATIMVTGADIIIAANGSLSINGFDNEKIIIDGTGNGRILTTSTGGIVSIRDVSFLRGNGVSTVNTGRGGAVYNNGANLTLTNVRLFNNTAVNGGALNTAGNGTTNIINCEIFDNIALTSSGGGLQNFLGATTNIYGSTFRRNTSNSGTGGGAIQSAGFTNITNSTFVGNHAASNGNGGAIAYSGAGMIMTNTTITGNTADNLTGGLHKTTTNVNTTIRNNIIAGNTAAGNSADIQGNFMSEGFNVIQSPGTATGLTLDDITTMPPLVTPIGNYGGLTSTQALLSGSPALRAGTNCVRFQTCERGNPPVPITEDQRGAPRSITVKIDSGSFENNPAFTAELDEGAVGAFYNETIATGVSGFTYTLVGSLPPGLEFVTALPRKEEATGFAQYSIFGTPTTLGTYNFGIMISNGTNSTTVNYQIRIAPTVFTGKLRNDAGNPVSGAFVTLDCGMGNVQRTQTSIDGTYTFSNITSGQLCTVSFASRRYAFRSEDITFVPGTNRIDPIIP